MALNSEYKNTYDDEPCDLCKLFNFYGSDKDRNGYGQIYFTLFDKLRQNAITLLEVGIGTMISGAKSSMVGYSLPGYKPGGSLRAWRDFFGQGRIVGFDVQPDTQFSEERIETYLCDTTKQENVVNIINNQNKLIKFDIIIDDGSHHHDDQLMTLNNLYPYLNEGGLYIIEDIYENSPLTTMPELINCIVKSNPYFFVGLKNNVCVIYKKPLMSQRENY